VVDAVFSMDGDVAPLPQLVELRDRHPNTMLMVDEAHSVGVLGHRARGIEEHFDRVGAVNVLMGTLSKAIPAQGGYIAGSHDLITYLRYSARGFVFSASLAPPTAGAALAALDVIEREGAVRRTQLMSNVHYFVGCLRDAGFDIGNTSSAIVPILLGSESLAFDMARACNAKGVYAMPVTYPAVAQGTERLRMNVTCDHRREDLDFAVAVLIEALAEARDERGAVAPLPGGEVTRDSSQHLISTIR
jgi:glycine C-acetyltransferase